jgi:hypothetical protein
MTPFDTPKAADKDPEPESFRKLAEAAAKVGKLSDAMEKLLTDALRGGGSFTAPTAAAASTTTPTAPIPRTPTPTGPATPPANFPPPGGGGKGLSSVPAFDRPLSVILAGPKPLPVKIEGGLPGGGRAPAPTTQQPAQGSIFTRLATNAFQQSRFGQAWNGRQQQIGKLLGGKGADGLQGLEGASKGLAKAGAVVAVVTEVAGAMKKLYESTIRLTDEQIAAARKFADVSGPMASVFAKRDVQELQRGMRQGDAQAASTGRLVDVEQRRKDAMEPLENALADMKNEVLTQMNEALIPAIKLCADVAEWIKNNWPWPAGWKKKEEDKQEQEGLVGIMSPIEAEAARIERRADELMAIARDNARRMGGGSAAPFGAMRPGGLS